MMMRISKWGAAALVALTCLLTTKSAYAVDKEHLRLVPIDFIDGYNKEEFSKLKQYMYFTEEDPTSVKVFEVVLRVLKEALGKITITDTDVDGKGLKSFGPEVSVPFSLLTRYHFNKANNAGSAVYKVTYENAGEGFVQFLWPAKSSSKEITDERLSAAIFYVPKKGNFALLTRLGSKLKDEVKPYPETSQ